LEFGDHKSSSGEYLPKSTPPDYLPKSSSGDILAKSSTGDYLAIKSDYHTKLMEYQGIKPHGKDIVCLNTGQS